MQAFNLEIRHRSIVSTGCLTLRGGLDARYPLTVLLAGLLHKGAGMADIINFRQARKAKVRADKEQAAAANRAKFGRTKPERQASLQEEARLERQLKGARRELGKDETE
ncbi:DUF4169 family protein [Sphingobium tyrosinilyticum]|uniref:DUF4169 family protein n=1 Tax=Sphingobium tyrosinilyticum TaxID=2715436 RepID=A0ABV9EV01_9SPHN